MPFAHFDTHNALGVTEMREQGEKEWSTREGGQGGRGLAQASAELQNCP